MEGIVTAETSGIKKLFGGCFELAKLEEGKPIPIGAGDVFGKEINLSVEGDFSSFEAFFEEVESVAADLSSPEKREKLSGLLQGSGIRIDPETFSLFIAFDRVYDKHHPYDPDANQRRKDLYLDRTNLKLSDIVENDLAACSEIAALAKYFLQGKGIDSYVISGDILQNKEFEHSSKHTYLVVSINNKDYIYDPANPLYFPKGVLPSLYEPSVDFRNELRKGIKRFVTCSNLITNKEVWYGVNNVTNIIPERDIV
jgi:hypothetical protein